MTREEIERRKALCEAAVAEPFGSAHIAFVRAHDPTTMLALYAELEALRGLESYVREEHEECRQAADHRANPARSYPCHACLDLAAIDAMRAQSETKAQP